MNDNILKLSLSLNFIVFSSVFKRKGKIHHQSPLRPYDSYSLISIDTPYKFAFLCFDHPVSFRDLHVITDIDASSLEANINRHDFAKGAHPLVYKSATELALLKKQRAYIEASIENRLMKGFYGNIEESRGLFAIFFYEIDIKKVTDAIDEIGLSAKDKPSKSYVPHFSNGLPVVPLIHREFFYLVDLVAKAPGMMEGISTEIFLHLLNNPLNDPSKIANKLIKKEDFIRLISDAIKSYTRDLNKLGGENGPSLSLMNVSVNLKGEERLKVKK